MNPVDLFTKHLESKNKLDQVVGLSSCRFWRRAAIAPTLESDVAVHSDHNPVLLPQQHLPQDMARMFPEAVADPHRRGDDDDDPVDELLDVVPALQALRRRMLAANAGKDPPPATGNYKSRRKRALPESTFENYDFVYLVGGREA